MISEFRASGRSEFRNVCSGCLRFLFIFIVRFGCQCCAGWRSLIIWEFIFMQLECIVHTILSKAIHYSNVLFSFLWALAVKNITILDFRTRSLWQ